MEQQSSSITFWALSSRNEWDYCKTVMPIPILAMCCRRLFWSMASNATKNSRRINKYTLLSMAVLRSSVKVIKAVSVLKIEMGIENWKKSNNENIARF